jgi:hypothetical protein
MVQVAHDSERPFSFGWRFTVNTQLNVDLIRLNESLARVGATLERQASGGQRIREIARDIIRKHDEDTAKLREVLVPRFETFMAQLDSQREQLSERMRDAFKQLSKQSHSL